MLDVFGHALIEVSAGEILRGGDRHRGHVPDASVYGLFEQCKRGGVEGEAEGLEGFIGSL